MNDLTDKYYSGTSGLVLPVPNKMYYPETFQDKSRLCYYAFLMNSIEINSSFYKMPRAVTLQKWADDTPAGFVFTFKLFQGITHQKDLIFDTEMLSQFMQAIAGVGEKKGCLLVQFPPSVRLGHLRQLERLMAAIRTNDPFAEWKCAFEFRHASLYTAEMYELLEQYQLGMVIHDKSPCNSPLISTHADFMYFRFHGPSGNYRGTYTADILMEYASYINEYLAEGKEVFVYFNNTMGEAYQNLKMLREMVHHNNVYDLGS